MSDHSLLRGNAARCLVAAGAAWFAVLIVAVTPSGSALGAPAGAGGVPTAAPTSTPVPTASETSTPTPTAPSTPSVSAPPSAPPTPTDTVPPDDRLLPDLVALAAARPVVQVVGAGRRLRFESALGNIGAGPIEVRQNRNHRCPSGQHNSAQIVYRDLNGDGRYNPNKDNAVRRHRAGCMVYHPYHQHWHFQATARYTLVDPRAAQSVVVSARRKVSFCLRDSRRVPERYGSFSYSSEYWYCTKNSAQGISVGWMDVYERFLAGQSLALPKNLPAGLYCLRTTVHPLDQLMEFDDSNNDSLRALMIRGNRVAIRATRLCR